MRLLHVSLYPPGPQLLCYRGERGRKINNPGEFMVRIWCPIPLFIISAKPTI